MVIQERQVEQVLTRSKLPDADYVINPYIGCANRCQYCYAEFMKRFAHVDEEWGKFIIVKNWNKPIPTENIRNKKVVISSVTDPYNAYEEKYRKTERILNEIKSSNAKIDILTKSTLVLRDIEIFKKIKNLSVGVSLGLLDEAIREKLEPGASSIPERIKMIETLAEQKIRVYVFLSPYFPGLSDYKELIRILGAKVSFYAFENLNLRGGYKYRILNFIKDNFPHLYPLYHDIYNKGNMDYWYELEKEINSYMKIVKHDYRMYFYHEKIKKL